MKALTLIGAFSCLLLSSSLALADSPSVDPSVQPQVISSHNSYVKAVATELNGKILKCSPVLAKDQDNSYYPLTIKLIQSSNTTTDLSVANSRGEDGLSNCCARVRYNSQKAVLKFFDGDDDNYMDLSLQIDSSSIKRGQKIKAIRRNLEDDMSVSSQVELLCDVE